MQDWPQIRAWRKAERNRLLAKRMALGLDVRTRLTAALVERLRGEPLAIPPSGLGFFWPMKGEPDLRAFVGELVGRGAAAALPVVVEKGAPLEFWRWTPATKLTRQSVWGIPVPAERVLARPEVVIAPLVGFDSAGYRLGYGGGYYDRTLAALDPRPFVIGVGFEQMRLTTIHPQPHDVPMDLIVTDAGVLKGGTAGRSVSKSESP